MIGIDEFTASGGPTVAGAPRGTTGAGEVIVALENAGFAVCTVTAEHMRSVGGVFAEFSGALEFPDYFGNNKDAFDECMRDLDQIVGEAPGYAVVIRHAAQLLADEPDELEWFTDAMAFCDEHYADAGVEFRVLLIAAQDNLADVLVRWRTAGGEAVALH